MDSHEEVRKSVSDHYARLVATGESCCSVVPSGASKLASPAASRAGYEPAELAAIPREAVACSHGCGNPVAASGATPGETVLDLGCGAGIDLLLAARRVGGAGRVIGVDMTPAMVEAARANVRRSGLPNIEVLQGILESLPVEEASVDLVISNCVINLSPDRRRVFAEIARVLRPGGRMVVSDLVTSGLPAWVRDDPTLHASCIGGAGTEEEYVSGLTAAGLSRVQVEERVFYDAAEMEARIAESLPGRAMQAAELARVLRDALWRARIVAYKTRS